MWASAGYPSPQHLQHERAVQCAGCGVWAAEGASLPTRCTCACAGLRPRAWQSTIRLSSYLSTPPRDEESTAAAQDAAGPSNEGAAACAALPLPCVTRCATLASLRAFLPFPFVGLLLCSLSLTLHRYPARFSQVPPTTTILSASRLLGRPPHGTA